MSKDITVQSKRAKPIYDDFGNVGSYITAIISFIDYQEQQIKDLQAKINTYEIEDSVTMKHVQHEPQRNSLCIYDGVEIFEETDAWFVDIKNLIITVAAGFDIDSWGESLEINESKVYLTPKEVNARLKQEVIKKAKERTFTLAELEKYDNDWFMMKKPIDFAIEAIEKKFNVKYIED